MRSAARDPVVGPNTGIMPSWPSPVTITCTSLAERFFTTTGWVGFRDATEEVYVADAEVYRVTTVVPSASYTWIASPLTRIVQVAVMVL